MSSAIEIDNSDTAVTGSIGPVPCSLPDLPGAPPLRRRTEAGPAPLSFAQERLWFLDQINPGDASLLISRGVRIRGDLNHDLLQRSLQAIVKRHESLRTTFATTQLYAGVDSKPGQLVAESCAIELVVTDLSFAPFDQACQKAQELAQAEAQRAFDLTIGPLVRAALLGLGEHEHVLLLTVHRIICDERSMDLLILELWRNYDAIAQGDDLEPAPLPIQFADYACWQRNSLTDEALKTQRDFWLARLQDAPVLLELPTDRARPAVQNWHGATLSMVLKEGLSQALIELSQDQHTTLFVTLMTAFQILLARYSRQTTIVTGSEFANRESAETRNLIGPLANAFALRSDLAGDPSFRTLLSAVNENVLESQAHQTMPFEKLVEEMQLAPSISHAPVFQVALNLRETPALDKSTGLELDAFDFEAGVASLDLTVNIQSVAGRFECRFEYDSDLFSADIIERLLGHYEVLLEGVVANPDGRLSLLPLLTEAERQESLVTWNETRVNFPTQHCIHQLFEAQAEKTLDAIALVCGNERLTYRELNTRANQLAHYLQRLGIGPEDRVGVCLRRTPAMLIAILGTLKAGGAYVPLDPAYPQERLAFTLQDAGAAVLLTQDELMPMIPETTARVVCIDTDWKIFSGEGQENPVSRVTLQNLGYVIYTSGSTGLPKGVAIEHASTVALLRWAVSIFDQRELAAVLASTSICFDLSVFEMFAPLCCGGKVVLVENALQLPELRESDVTLINTVPSAMAELVRVGGIPLSVSTINLAGEPLTNSLTQGIYEQETVQQVLNLYGPSEDTTYSTFVRLTRGATDEPSIGRPVANTEVYLLDRYSRPVPVGVPGELHLGGAGLARGYLNRPALTAEKFVPNPFSKEQGARLYRTGDLARYHPDGTIQFLGRMDNQVKLRGYRIELGEIEATLRKHTAVQDVAVMVREFGEGNSSLVGYVVVDPMQAAALGEDKLAGELKIFLKQKLPDYMVPAFFVALDHLPLTPNGKVDRRALPKPEEGRRNLDQTFVAPRDNLERQLANIWEKILDVKTVGVQDSFFELGGHSLFAVRLFAQIENRFGRRLPLAALFQAPTIEQLANVLRETTSSKAWASLVPIQPLGSKPPLFCVHAAGANVLIYRPLSRHLGNEQPVYALQAQGLDGQRPPLLHIEDMAAHYIREMRAFQPEGPYRLLGASFGGLVIFEMAQQLLAQGQEVALMAMLNTNCPVYPLSKKMQFHMAHLRQHGARFYAREIWKTLRRKMGNPTVSVEINGSADPELAKLVADSRHGDEALIRTVLAILDAEKDYVPAGKIYPGKITFFWAKDDEANVEDNRLGWQRLAAGGLEVHEVPGTHGSMREEPNVAMLVAELRPCLESALPANDDHVLRSEKTL